jgi:hypothetical protein
VLSVEFGARLTAQGLTTGYTVMRGALPATPDKVIVVNETGGAGPSLTFGGGVVENPNVQVVVRGLPDDSDTPRLTVERIYQAAMNWGAFTQGGTRFLSVTPLAAPFPRDRDGNRRVEWAVNFAVEKELSSTA